MKENLLTKVDKFLRYICSEESIEKFQEKMDNFFNSLYTYPHDYIILIYYKMFGNGCNPVEKYDGKHYCDISKKFHHKTLVSHLCKNGKPKLESRRVKVDGCGRHLYSYCECSREK